MVDLNAHEAGNGGQSQGKPTTRGVLLYSEREGPAADPRLETIRSAGRAFTQPTRTFTYGLFDGLVTRSAAGYRYGGNWASSTGGTSTR